MKTLVRHSALFTLIGLILSPLAIAHASSSQEQASETADHNVMLRVVRVTPDWVPFANRGGWTEAALLKESEKLKYYEVAIWEETSSVHLYEFPNDYEASNSVWDGQSRTFVPVPEEERIAYREQFLISKYTDMPQAYTDERSAFLKSAFMDIASHLVSRHPNSDHHFEYFGHGGPGGALFELQLKYDDAHEFLNFWSQSLGEPLGVIDMGGPCTKGGFADLENFCKSARYYVASDLPNGGYTFDNWTFEKHQETHPDAQYHNLFSVNANLEEALKGRIDLKRTRYEYSRNNMITNEVSQANYLYSCAEFRKFSPDFKSFFASAGVDYRIGDDLYQYLIDNNASPTLVEQFNKIIVHKADNKDFFEWSEVRNGIQMPVPGLLFRPLGSEPGTNTVAATVEGLEAETFTATAIEQTPHSLTKVSGDGQEGLAGIALAAPFVVSVLDEDDEAIAGVVVTFSVTGGGGILSSTTATTDANGQATTTLTLTLGSDAETTTVAATVEGLESVTFTVTAVGQATPDSLAKVSGDGQEGLAGAVLAEPFVVSVLDEDGAAIAGAVVTFAVTAGGGTLSSTTSTTDANGRAATRLTLGSDAGTNTVSATVEGLEPVTFTATGQKSPFASLFDLFGGGKLVALPDSPQLAQNAPNPFNSQTVLAYFLPAPGPAHVEVFALTGQRVAVLRQGPQQAGYHRLHWDARDDAGRPVASGMYLYRLVTEEVVLTRKLILLR